MKRAVLVCPGRGSYSRESLGMLQDLSSPALARLDKFRASHGAATPTDIDGAERFSSRKHIAGEHASLLTAACTLADIDQIDSDAIQIVGACGNSMGWYTTLAASGVLTLEEAAELIDTLGGYQAEELIGGQLVYPFYDEEWHIDPTLSAQVSACVDGHPGLHWSILLGGQAVLGGTEEGIAHAVEALPALESKGIKFPLRLPLHAAFHTPLMVGTAERARADLAHLNWRKPEWPIVDGHGHLWHPHHADPSAIRDYTLGPQITEMFDFTVMLRSLLGETGPDHIILPGPGSNLGGAIAQVLIELGWSQIHSRSQFLERQQQDPVLLALSRPEQRARVTR